MINKKSSNKRIYLPYWISVVFSIFYIYYTTGQVIGSFTFFLFSSLLLSLWFITSFISSPLIFIKIWDKKYIFFFLFLFYYFVSGLYINNIKTQFNGTLSIFLFFSPIYMYDYYKQLESNRINQIFLISILLILCIYSIKTIIYLKSNPYAARELISVGIEDKVSIGGGFALAYALAILVPCLVYILLNIKKFPIGKPKRLVLFISLVILIILFSYTIIISLFFIAVLLMISGIMFCLFIRNKEKILPTFCVLLAFYSILFLFIGPILSSYITGQWGTNNSFFARKIVEFTHVLKGQENGFFDDTSSRFSLYFSSIKMFLNNLILGIGYKFGYDSIAMQRIGLGNHSEWFDTMAIYGLVGSTTIFTFLYLIIKKNFTTMLVKIGSMIFLIMGFLNPNRLFTIYLVLFLLLPLIGKNIQKQLSNH